MNDRVIIVDSSPLIALAVINRLDILRNLYAYVVIPPMVWEEVTVKGKGMPGADVIGHTDWLKIKTPQSSWLPPLSILVDKGEAEVLALSQEITGSTVLLDDAAARRVAERLGIRCIGTLGILRAAKNSGLVTRVLPLINKMNDHGIYIKKNIVEILLRNVGELTEEQE